MDEESSGIASNIYAFFVIECSTCRWNEHVCRSVARILSLVILLVSVSATLNYWQQPAAEAKPASPAIRVSGGGAHSLVLRSDGTIWGLGRNAYGQLGTTAKLGENLPNPTPTQVDGLSNVIAIAAGGSFSLALRSDGTVWAFGINSFGQLGLAATIGLDVANPTPTQVAGLSNVIAIAAGTDHSLALRSDGTVWGFGVNEFGQLGTTANNGTRNPNPTPTQVPGLSNVTAIDAGSSHSLVLRSDGSVWGFGVNEFGQLGTTANNGTRNPNPTPTQVPGLSSIVGIAAGGGHSLVLRSDGTVSVFGANQEGQLAVAPPNNNANPTPTPVPGLNNIVMIDAGSGHNLLLRSDGTVWTFGDNYRGQLGPRPSSGSSPTPAVVPGLSNVVAIAAGSLHNLVTLADGTVWAFGDNLSGEVGPTANQQYFSNPIPQRVSGVGKAAAGGVVRVHVTDTANATVLGNLTIDQPDDAGYTTVYPCIEPRPIASNSNYLPGQTIANFVAARADALGDICIYTTAAAHVIWDQVAATTAITATNATRLADTRTGTKPTAAAEVRVHVTNTPNVTVLGNLTINQPDGGGYTTVYPCAEPRPIASNSNYLPGQTIANFVAARADAARRHLHLHHRRRARHLGPSRRHHRDHRHQRHPPRRHPHRHQTNRGGRSPRARHEYPQRDRARQLDHQPTRRRRLHHRLPLRRATTHRLQQQLPARPNHRQLRRRPRRRPGRHLHLHHRRCARHLGPSRRHHRDHRHQRHPPRRHPRLNPPTHMGQQRVS